MSSCVEIITLCVNCLTAIGTIAVAIVAIWGDYLKDLLFRPALTLSLLEEPLDFIPMDCPRFYVHLRLRNTPCSRWRKAGARSCRVMLIAIQKKLQDGTFNTQWLPVPHQLTWAPSEMPPLQRDVSPEQEEILDLGFLKRSQDHGGSFRPQSYVLVHGYEERCCVRAGETTRYVLDVLADNWKSQRTQVFEVSWDGHWDNDPAVMQQHLRVSDVTHESESRMIAGGPNCN